MARIVAARVRQPGARTERVFYCGLAGLLAALIFCGFAPTFYARGMFFDTPPLRPLVLAHGTAFTLWVLLFAVQPPLIAAGRVRWHRRLGVAGAVLAAVTFATGLAVIAAFERGHLGESRGTLAVHLFANVAPLCAFAGFVAAGVLRRRDAAAHKRLMLLATVVLLPAATGRLLGYFGLELYSQPLYVCFAFASAAYDQWTRGRVHRVSWWGGVLLVALDVSTTLLLRLVE